MKRKKFLGLLIMFFLLLGLISCGGKKDENRSVLITLSGNSETIVYNNVKEIRITQDKMVLTLDDQEEPVILGEDTQSATINLPDSDVVYYDMYFYKDGEKWGQGPNSATPMASEVQRVKWSGRSVEIRSIFSLGSKESSKTVEGAYQCNVQHDILLERILMK